CVRGTLPKPSSHPIALAGESPSLRLSRTGKPFRKLLRAHPDGFQRFQALLERGIIDGDRVKLLGDVSCNADSLHLLHVSRSRAECQTAEHVERLLLLRSRGCG